MRKQFLFTMFFLLGFLGFNAQPTLDKILPENKCNKEDIISSFILEEEKNLVAIEIIDPILKSEKKYNSYMKTLLELNEKALKEVKSIFKESDFQLLKEFNISKIGDEPDDIREFKDKKVELACEISRRIHDEYIIDPSSLKEQNLLINYAFYADEELVKEGGTSERRDRSDRNGADIKEPKTALSTDKTGMDTKNTGRRDETSDGGGIGFLMLLFWTLLVAGFSYLFLKKKYKRQVIDQAKREILSPNFKTQFDGIGGSTETANTNGNNRSAFNPDRFVTKDQLQNEIYSLKKVINQLAQQTSTSQDNTNRESSSFSHSSNQGSHEQNVIPLPPIYSPPPTQDGLFYGSKMNDSFKEGTSIYSISVDKTNPNTAEYQLIESQEVISQAASYPSSYLTPGCQLRGTGSIKDAHNLEIMPGQLVKQGDNWKITEKVILTW